MLKVFKKRKGLLRKMYLFAAAVGLLLFLWWQTNSLTVTQYTFAAANLSQELQGFCIVQLSDLHNKRFGGRLIEAVAAQKPDIIAITGDIVSRSDKDSAGARALVEEAVKVAPVYYVSGNHEAVFPGYEELTAYLDAQGVTRLEDVSVVIQHGGGRFNLIGLRDPAFYSQNRYLDPDAPAVLQARLSENLLPGMPNVVLAHRPSLLQSYAAAGADLVLTGHAHGGQIRLPFVGALVAPDEGFFPRYTSGIHRQGSTAMVVSRGLGDSKLMPIRLFNRPEVVVIRFETRS